MIVPDTWDIPIKIRERFGDEAGRQRAMNAEGHLLLVLHDPPGPHERYRKARLVWRNPAGLWSCNIDGSVTNLLKKHVAAYQQRAEQLENDLHAAACAADYFQLLQAVTPLHRASHNLHATLQQAREMIPDDHEIIVARDSAGDLERAMELLQLDAKNALDYTIAERAELQAQRSLEMAASAHRLNVLAALFCPVTAISAIFGMNFASGLESIAKPWLFWGVLVIEFVVGLVLVRAVAKPYTAAHESPRTNQGMKRSARSCSDRVSGRGRVLVVGASLKK
jgi:Mg2+ and Co2+ transporter CorA